MSIPAAEPEVVVPPVTVEVEPDEEMLPADPVRDEPFEPPAERTEAWLPVREPARLPNVRLRRPDVASPPVLVEQKPEVPASPPPAPASAFVEASPRADNAPPEYPASDRAAGREGTVVVLASIDALGDVTDVTLATASPHPGLNRAALQAVRRWRFEPASRDGVPVAGRLELPIVFRLTDR